MHQKSAQKIIFVLSILAIITSLFVSLFVSFKTQLMWLAANVLSNNERPFYLNVLIAGHALGKAQDTEIVLAEVEKEISSQNFTLTANGKNWPVNAKQIGISLDKDQTRGKIEELNNLDLLEKIRFIFEHRDGNYTIDPVLSYDAKKCKQALAMVSVPETFPKSAMFYFDGGIRIRPDSNGEKLNLDITCQGIAEDIGQGATSGEIRMETIDPAIKKYQLEKILPQAEGLAGKSLTFSYHEKSWIVGPQEIMEMFHITSNQGGTPNISWDQSKLDTLISSFEVTTNSNNPAPKLGSCETLIWSGGYRLDKDNLKEIFVDLGPKSPRHYALKVDYFSPSIQKINPVKKGTKGTIFLTFDDGMIHSNQIMNLAECYGIKVTFFVIGQRAYLDAPTMRRAIANAEGVQSHGYEHAAHNYASGHSYLWQYNDIHKSIFIITAITGVRPTYFRPPGGNWNEDTKRAAVTNGVRMVLWNTTSIDTVTYVPSQICRNVIYHLVPQGTVLMHSTKSATVAALPCIIEGIAKDGYSMAALR